MERQGELEAAVTSVLTGVCVRRNTDWFGLISQKLCDSAAEDTHVQLHYLLSFDLLLLN